jgi:CRISPR-associated endonuclease Csn1
MIVEKLPVRFAFDLGTNSIGWAVYRLDGFPGERVPTRTVNELRACGVRLFDDGRNPKDGRSLAEMRRVPRSARRRRDRFVVRRAALISQLRHIGLLPTDDGYRRALAVLDPYQLRSKGLDSALKPEEIGRVLMHINQRRGFQSNRRADRKSKADDQGKIAQGTAKLSAALKASDARTFGEFLWRRRSDPNGAPLPVRKRAAVRIRIEGQGAKALYDMYPSRQMLMSEFDMLMAKQAQHHKSVLTFDTIADIRDTIFHQRPLKPTVVGKCTFVPDETRLPKALPSVEARVIYEMLNHLRFGDGVNMIDKLDLTQRDLLASRLLAGESMTFGQLRKDLKIGTGVRISLEEAGKDGLDDYRAHSGALIGKRVRGKVTQEYFGSRWLRLPLVERDEIVQCLINTEQEEIVVEWLMSDYNLPAEAARAVAEWNPPDGHGRLGRTATSKILAELMASDLPTYSEAVERAGWHHSDERDGVIELPLPYYGQVLERHVIGGTGEPAHGPEKRYGRFPNPTAHVALNQLRRVVNELVKSFGEPTQVIIELARELKQSQEQKEKEQKRNRDNRTIKDRHRVILAEHRQIEDGANFLRLRLFEEQERAGGGVAKCPFTLRPIMIAELFSSEVEIEHLLPYSKTFDDSAANKVVCLREANRIKRAKSPHQAFGGTPIWPEIEAAAQSLPPNKRWRFAANAMERYDNTERDFLARQLNETRHLSRMARIYLSKACHPDQVYVTTGQLTAMLRSRWGLNAIWRDHNSQPTEDEASEKKAKARDDHRHHAVDACVIGAIDRRILQAAAREAAQAEFENRSRVTDKVEEPFAGFREAVRTAVEKVIVSVKPEHSKGGALHEDTAYGLVTNPGEATVIGNLVYRKPLVDLKPGEIDSVRDEHLRRQLQSLAEPFRDAKGKLKDEKGLQGALSVFAASQAPGREQGIRRVRIGKEKRGELHIKDRRTGAVYKALLPGENHHIDIVQMRDGTWRGFAATVFDVNQKGWRPQWEVDKLGGKLVMRLHKGDAVEIDDTDGVRRVKTVHRLSPSNGIVYLAAHNEAGALGKRHDDKADPFRWDFANIAGMKARVAKKLQINSVGQVYTAKSNCG